ncbi:MAG TPA: beta-hydroxyacyl-ACP dehydratase [Desulfocapsa sulfexigens]|nr:beta-hydroxyacyl-ACP dehydratase [Desulfocapsa sulfexigens]
MIENLKVTDLIPHRPPFLWVDSMLEFSSESLVTEKFIPKNLDLFQGHYPDHPILPGVILCEALFQTGALLIALLLKDSQDSVSGVPVLTRIEGVKFKRPVGPGETIQMKVNLKETLGGAWFLKGTLRVRGKVAVQVNFACTLADMQ